MECKLDILEMISKLPQNVTETKYIIIDKKKYIVQMKLKRIEVLDNKNNWVIKKS